MDKQTAELIRDLATRLGVTTDRLIDLFIPPVVVGAVFWLVVSIAVLGAIWWLMRKAYTLGWFEEGEVLFFSSLGAFVVGFIFLVALGSSIQDLVSPRAAAILKILSAIKPD